MLWCEFKCMHIISLLNGYTYYRLKALYFEKSLYKLQMLLQLFRISTPAKAINILSNTSQKHLLTLISNIQPQNHNHKKTERNLRLQNFLRYKFKHYFTDTNYNYPDSLTNLYICWNLVIKTTIIYTHCAHVVSIIRDRYNFELFTLSILLQISSKSLLISILTSSLTELFPPMIGCIIFEVFCACIDRNDTHLQQTSRGT